MKFNITVETDAFNEEEGLDETIQKQVIEEIARRVTKTAEKKIAERISDLCDSAVNELVKKTYEGFIDRTVTIADNWGGKKEEVTIMELIQRKIDGCLMHKVDKDGRFTEGSYSEKGTFMEWIINRATLEQVQKMGKEIAAKAEDNIKVNIKKVIEAELTDKVAKCLNIGTEIEKLFPKQK